MGNPFFDTEDDIVEPHPECDHEGCHEPGLYPAPKSRVRMNERYHFCLEHVREYNKKWNYFDGFSQDQIYAQMQKDTGWDRPTWPSSISVKLEERLHAFIHRFTKDNSAKMPKPKTTLSKEAQALQTLGLNPQSDTKSIKTRYRELVKKYHPDKNPDNPKAVERFKIISEAYMVLRSTWQTKDVE